MAGNKPDVDFDQIWHSRHADEPQSSNYVGCRNKEADKIIQEMEFEFDMPNVMRWPNDSIGSSTKSSRTHLYQTKAPYFWTPQVQNAESVGRVRPYKPACLVLKRSVGGRYVNLRA